MSKGLADTVAATKFLKAFAGNEGINVQFIQGLKVPNAQQNGTIRVAPPTIDTLGEWNWNVHHEVSHVMPANLFHFDALNMLAKGKMVLNIISDNLAERFEYNRYEGRKMILSGERYKFLTENKKKLFERVTKSKEDRLILGLMVWDCMNRTEWMDYPMSTFSIETTPYQGVLDYLEGIQLGKLMDNCETALQFHLLVLEILKYTEQEELDEEEESEGENQGDNPDSSGDREDQSGDQAKEPSDSDLPKEQQEGGAEGQEPDSEGGSGEPSRDGDSGNEDGGSDLNDDADKSNDNETETSGDKVRGEESDPGRETESSGEETSGVNTEEHDSADQGREDVTAPWLDENVSSETNEALDDFIPNRNPKETGSVYEPFSTITWHPLAKSRKRGIHQGHIDTVTRLIANSRVSKGIKKYLQAMNQVSYQYGMKSGRMSPSKIFRTSHGGDRIFRQRLAGRIDKNTAIQVVMDCSGSMVFRSHRGMGGPNKLYIAQASCSILGDTLGQLGIPYEIIGFTHDRFKGVQMFEFKKFNEKLNKAQLIDRMCSVPWTRDNADAESLLEAASRLNKRTEANRIMIVLSDGEPAAYFQPDHWAAYEYLKKVCSHIEDDTTMDLMSIGINSDSVKKFYKNHTVINDPSQLDGVLMELLKNKLV